MARKKNSMFVVFIIILLFVSSCEKFSIRKDLFGKSLVEDDFSFLLNGRHIFAFQNRNAISEIIPGGNWINLNTFYSSEDVNLPGRADIQTEEYITNDVRFVFFEGIYHEIRDGKNGFTSLKNNSMTIRGISVGDSIDDVFKAYGKTKWISERADKWYVGWLSFKYKHYYNAEIEGEIQEIYDCIEFEIHDGIVVGIYYHFMNSDGI